MCMVKIAPSLRLYCNIHTYTHMICLILFIYCKGKVTYGFIQQLLHWGTAILFSKICGLFLTSFWPLNKKITSVFVYHVNFLRFRILSLCLKSSTKCAYKEKWRENLPNVLFTKNTFIHKKALYSCIKLNCVQFLHHSYFCISLKTGTRISDEWGWW